MKIQFTSNYGNFDYRMDVHLHLSPAAEAALTDDDRKLIALIAKGHAANTSYRVAGSAVDKALGVKDRKALMYSEADAGRIDTAVSAKLTELEAKDESKGGIPKGLFSFAVTGQHVFGETDAAPTKEATELWTQVQQMPAEAFEAALTKLGLGTDYDDATGISACMTFLREQKRAAMEKAKAETKSKLGL